MNRRIEYIRAELNDKSIDELRSISTNRAKDYSAEEISVAEGLLIERDPELDNIDRILHMHRKSGKSILEMERKVGCIFQFVVFQVVLMVIALILRPQQAAR